MSLGLAWTIEYCEPDRSAPRIYWYTLGLPTSVSIGTVPQSLVFIEILIHDIVFMAVAPAPSGDELGAPISSGHANFRCQHLLL
jgi:hypothetical protein